MKSYWRLENGDILYLSDNALAVYDKLHAMHACENRVGEQEQFMIIKHLNGQGAMFQVENNSLLWTLTLSHSIAITKNFHHNLNGKDIQYSLM